MASTGVNVLRYSALGAGIFYGFYHQSQLTAASKLAAIHKDYAHKENLIKQAKSEFAKKNAPASKGGVISDPNDSRFDLEALLNSLDAKSCEEIDGQHGLVDHSRDAGLRIGGAK
ncbi:hypothetical protein VTL71DRAFT_13930 [Oculimacula yallundae]|uniref:ATP synthase F(0) complex subunit e, mitochondrial n=1 Tax=Oculimacula yallundae TaxID=86028 RepID=A0ABR4CMA7_9HELO